MNNEIVKVNEGLENTINTREVAEMMETPHADILKKLEGTKKADRTVKQVGIIPTFTKGNIPLSEYFIEDTYKDTTGRSNKQYLCTRLGCEFLANKFTGEKGILFTAKYVKKFNQMEKQIQKIVSSFMIEDPIERAKAWIVEQEKSKLLIEEKNVIIEELSPLAELARKRIDKTGTVGIKDATKTFECKQGQITTWAKVKGYIHKSQMDVNELGEKYFKAIGVEYKNIGILEEGLKLIDKNLDEIKTYPCSYKAYLKIKEEN